MSTNVLTLAEAKLALSITGNAQDDELADYIAAAVETVDELCGPTDPVTRTDVIRGGGRALVLTSPPVLSLISITGHQAGVVAVSGHYVTDPLAGVVYAYGLPLSDDVWTVVYRAGRPVVPAAIKTGAKIILKSLWSVQRGPSRGPRGDDTELAAVPGLGMAVPRRALLALDAHLRGPAVG